MKSATRGTSASPGQNPQPSPGQKLAPSPRQNTAPNPGPKSKTAKEGSSDSEPSGNPAPKPGLGKSAQGPDGSTEKSDPAPVIAAIDPTAVADEALMLKIAEAASQSAPASQPAPASPPVPASQPHSNPEPAAVPVQIVALPQPAAAPSVSVAAQASSTPAADSSEDDTREPVQSGNLIFQLSLDPSEPTQKARITPTGEENETTSFLSAEDVPSSPPPQAGASGSDAKSQDQQEQQSPLLPQISPQLSPAAIDGTIASQFGFQTPLSYAVQTSAPKTEGIAAPAPSPMAENASAPDLPMAPSIDHVGLTLRGADNQIVRVEISQSGELVQVGVHTGNTDLASELRASVPELMHRLDQQGYESRVSMPAASLSSLAAPVIASAHSEFRSGADQNGNTKSNSDAAPQEELRQQRQRNPQRAWRELASQLQED
jgi:hypothetical protein